MGWFGSSESETRWSNQVEEFEYAVDAACDLAKDTLQEMERLKSRANDLRRVSKQYEDSPGVLETLADKFDSIISRDIEDVVSELQRARDAATHLGRVVDSMG